MTETGGEGLDVWFSILQGEREGDQWIGLDWMRRDGIGRIWGSIDEEENGDEDGDMAEERGREGIGARGLGFERDFGS